eukprot:4680417-Pyramimonas_sp.AAC.1
MTSTYRWQQYDEGSVFIGEAPAEVDPGLTPGPDIDPLELAQAKYSAFCGGPLVSTLLSDNGWYSFVQEDLGFLLHHAFGPSGRACKWANLCTDSTWIMQPKKGSKGAKHK